MSNRKETARAAVLQALATLRMVGLKFYTLANGVNVPSWLQNDDFAVLNFGRRAPTPIDDLETGPDAISGTLRFGDEYHYCSIPWEAITGIVTHGPKPAARAWTPTVIDGGKS